ncbi:RNB domain-containing ribonuclease [Helicobacter bilis]|uniref:RNB domain-containing ribonuclease n=1 Tax=Helicobacter bilis TaxID=37372 RepID=UPI0025581C47|nr:RNB domain-containing ribonuclease [Helicobacter bilis]
MRKLSIKNGTKYAEKLALFHALSKTPIKIGSPIQSFLNECKNKLISTKGEYYFLPKNVKFMVVTKLEKIPHTDTSYKLMLTEAFFSISYKRLQAQKDSIRKDSIRTNPYIYYVTLTSKKPLQIHDLLLIRIKKDSKKYQEIPKNDYRKVMQLELHYKHGLNMIMNKNLYYANNQHTSHIKQDSKKHKTTESNAVTRHICMITERKKRIVAQALNTRMILPVKATQKALKALPKFTLIAVNENNEITEVLGNLTQGSLDREIALYINDYTPKDFSQKALNEAENMAKSFMNTESIPLPKNHIKKQLDNTLRYDLTHLPFCTIDPVNAKDHDDAIYYDSKHSILYVAIADVSSYVSLDSTLDKEARDRAFSLYFPNKVFPMLPPQLSSQACSLKQDEKRLALVWALKLHKRNVKVLHSQIFKAVICSHASLNYKQVSHFLESRLDSSLKFMFKQAMGLQEGKLDFIQDSKNHATNTKQDSTIDVSCYAFNMTSDTNMTTLDTTNDHVILRKSEKSLTLESKKDLESNTTNTKQNLRLESKKDSKSPFAPHTLHPPKISLEPSLETKPINNQAIEESLLAFSKLAVLLYKKRMQNGIDLALRDFSLQVDSDEGLDSITIDSKDISHTIVEEAMLLANQASAMYLHSIKHGIYRNHAEPNKRDFYKLLNILADMNIRPKSIESKRNKKHNSMLTTLQALQKEAIKKHKRHIADFCIVRHFAKANYMSNSIGHFGLGFPFYTHFTSPIRRYSDLLIHRLITAHLQNNTKILQYIMRETKTILAHINKREVQFDSIESYYKRLKMLRYAQSLVPFNDEALVFMVRKNVAYGFPLHKVGYCSVEIDCKDCVINTHEVIQIQIVDVDFNTLSLKAEPITQKNNT